jgi:predicted transposase YdaD
MKTDELFYELFKVDPKSIFRLVQLDLEGEYTFESLTLKTTEKRLDGFGKRIDGPGPNAFVEIQGYDDARIYWRAFQELCMYYTQNDDSRPFILIVLFLDETYDPDNCPLLPVDPPHQFIRANLRDCLEAVGEQAGALTVLKPLVVARKKQVFEKVQHWKQEIRSLNLPEDKIRTLLGLLEYLIVQRFPTINRKEIETMLHLTPIEETVVGQELIQIGKQEGRQEGRKEGEKKGLNKGELIGEIRLAQKILKRPVSSRVALAKKSLKALKAIFQELEAELATLNEGQEI